MNPRTLLLLLSTAALAGTAGWLAARRPHRAGPEPHPAAPAAGERRILYYQSAMHPWIRSDHPGKCTICGMELTPVLEGEAGFSLEQGLVSLSSNGLSVLQVQAVEAAVRPLRRTLRVAGLVEDDDSRHRFLSATAAGRIEELHVGYVGAEVEAGQPLARMYSPMLLEAERQFLAVARQLPAIGGGGDTRDEEHRHLRAAAATRLRQLGLSDAQIEALPSKDPTNHFTEIPSPTSGTVVGRMVYAGQYVMEGEKLFEIADLSTLWFRFDAYEQDLPWLRTGLVVEITTPSLPGRTFEAPIRFIDPSLAEMSRTTKVRVEIPNPLVDDSGNPRRLLRHRLYAEGRVHVDIPDVLTIPRSAVLSPAGDPVVYVDRTGGTFEQRRIKLGRIGDTDCEVLSGLAAGERVVVSGNLMIDAQAQLNQTIAAASHPQSPDSRPEDPSLSPLPKPAEQAIHRLLGVADALRAALAADDVPGFAAAKEGLPAAVESTRRELAADSPWQPALAAILAASRMPEASDLRSARRAFHPFSVAVVELGTKLRKSQPVFRNLRIYQCPMTSEAFEGAPNRAPWLQLAPPLRNPWFGAEMLDCGSEIRP